MTLGTWDTDQIRAVISTIRRAARDDSPVNGLTHRHYKYPARFSPVFVSAVIQGFSKPGALVLDPYVGGGTTVVEALRAGRRAVGCDVNSLGIFVTRAKTLALTRAEISAVSAWSQGLSSFKYYDTIDVQDRVCPSRTKNMGLPRAKPIKKFLIAALAECEALPSLPAQTLARCILLNVSQWALNGRKTPPTLSLYRQRLLETTDKMVAASLDFSREIRAAKLTRRPTLIHGSAEDLPTFKPFTAGTKADLVVTSPPYPGVHVLYHRWQVDGRRETPAPYWIADCLDGQGSGFYNFGSRKQVTLDDYFDTSFRTLCSIRSVMKDGATFVQMLAFSNVAKQLPRYLENMKAAGFSEMRQTTGHHRRIWRRVPGRSWHAELKGNTSAAREVVLIHTAV